MIVDPRDRVPLRKAVLIEVVTDLVVLLAAVAAATVWFAVTGEWSAP